MGRCWLLLITVFLASSVWAASKTAPSSLPKYFKPPVSTADHTKFEALKKDFKAPEEVTKACLSCHNKAGEQVKETLHFTWTWKGKDGRLLGKAHVINNF